MSLADSVSTAASIAEVLWTRASQAPDALAFRFLLDGEDKSTCISYGELDRQARNIATTLQSLTSGRDRVLLLYGPGLEFIEAFFGCLYAGVVPVPTYPPRRIRSIDGWLPLAKIAADCQARLILTGGSIAPMVVNGIRHVPSLVGVHCLATDNLEAISSDWRLPAFDENDLALLQYTSGSTAEPKGVMVTHRAMMHNQRMIQVAFEHNERSRGVSWLPLYHDMGLIGSVLQMIFVGGSCVLMSSFVFLQRPFRWLRAISQYRADTSPAPNFAFDYCTQWVTTEEMAGLDLSAWTVAAIGAEPIHAATLHRFGEKFAACGFRREALYPCYGLAEATLFVTGGEKGRGVYLANVDAGCQEKAQTQSGSSGPSGTRELVGCGHSWLGQETRIVDPESSIALPDDAVGEIWVRGPSVADGYWNRPEETGRVFRAHLSTGEGPFLRTGDLGFLRDGELFVTGRLKDVIIFRGRNVYPQDIEQTVQSVHPDLRRGFGAVFQCDRQDLQRVVILQEVERGRKTLDFAEVVDEIRQAVIGHHELVPDDILLVDAGSIPMTTSGKVQRYQCRIDYERGALRTWKGTQE